MCQHHATVYMSQSGTRVFACQNGLVSGAPYVLMWIMMLVSGMVADMLQKKKILSTTNVRKLANGVGKWWTQDDWSPFITISIIFNDSTIA